MSDDQKIIELLQEIRDLQKQHVTNYENALKNQAESIELQRVAVERQRKATTKFLIIFIVSLIFLSLTRVFSP